MNFYGAWRSRLALLLGSCWILSLAGPAFASQSVAGSMIIRVYDLRHAPRKTLARAEREAGALLAQAGVQTIWEDCGADAATEGFRQCLKADGMPVLDVEILAGHVHNQFLDTVSGSAIASVGLAEIYYDDTPMPLGDTDSSDFATVLGCVIAHEIGHLLLGSHSHSIAGLMQAQWGTEQLQLALMGKLLFSSKESRLLQEEAQARIHRNRVALASALSSP